MPRRSILTARQRATLFDLPTDEARILYHYTLCEDGFWKFGVSWQLNLPKRWT